MSTGRRRQRQLGMGLDGGRDQRLSKPLDAKTAAGVLMMGVVSQAPSHAAGGSRSAASKGDSSGGGPSRRGAASRAGPSHEGACVGERLRVLGTGLGAIPAEAGDHASAHQGCPSQRDHRPERSRRRPLATSTAGSRKASRSERRAESSSLKV